MNIIPLIGTTEQVLTEETTTQINNLPGVNTYNPGNILQRTSTSELDPLIPGIEIDNSDEKELAKRSTLGTADLPKEGVDLQFARMREYYIHHDPKYLEELPNPRHTHTWGGHNFHGRTDTFTTAGIMGKTPTKIPFYVKDVAYKWNQYQYWWEALIPK